MNLNMTQGECMYCNQCFSFDEMTSHLVTSHNDQFVNDPNELSDEDNNSNDIYLFTVERGKIIKDDDFTIDKVNKFWFHVAIKGKKTFEKLNDIIRAEWHCCNMMNISNVLDKDAVKHCCTYKTNNSVITSSKINKTDKKLNVAKLCDELKLGSNISYELDDVLTTNAQITLVHIFRSKSKDNVFKQICAKNINPVYQCKTCREKFICTHTLFCTGCNKIMCVKCSQHECSGKRRQYMCGLENNPRSGILCFDLDLYKIGREANQLYGILNEYRGKIKNN